MNKHKKLQSLLRSVLLICVVTVGLLGILGSPINGGGGGGDNNAGSGTVDDVGDESGGEDDGGTVEASGTPYFSVEFLGGLPELVFFQIGNSEMQQILPEDFEQEDLGVTASSFKTAQANTNIAGQIIRVTQFDDESIEELPPTQRSILQFIALTPQPADTLMTFGMVGIVDGTREGRIYQTTIGEATGIGAIHQKFGTPVTALRTVTGNAEASFVNVAFGPTNNLPHFRKTTQEGGFAVSLSVGAATDEYDIYVSYRLGADGYTHLERDTNLSESRGPISLLPKAEYRNGSASVLYAGLSVNTQGNNEFSADFSTPGAGGLTTKIAQESFTGGEDRNFTIEGPPASSLKPGDTFALHVSNTESTNMGTVERRNSWLLPATYVDHFINQNTPRDPVSVTFGDTSGSPLSIQYVSPVMAAIGLMHQYIDLDAANENIAINVTRTAENLRVSGQENSWNVGIPTGLSGLTGWDPSWNLGQEDAKSTSAVFSSTDIVETIGYLLFDIIPPIEEEVDISSVRVWFGSGF